MVIKAKQFIFSFSLIRTRRSNKSGFFELAKRNIVKIKENKSNNHNTSKQVDEIVYGI